MQLSFMFEVLVLVKFVVNISKILLLFDSLVLPCYTMLMGYLFNIKDCIKSMASLQKKYRYAVVAESK